MGRRILSALLLTLCAAMALGQPFEPGEVLAKFRSDSPLYRIAGIAAIGGKAVEELREIGVTRIRIPGWNKVQYAVKRLKDLRYVEFAEPNYIYSIRALPNDPLLLSQWHLGKTRCPSGWDLSQGSPSIVIAILDTGVDLDHPDLQSKLVPGANFVNAGAPPDDDHGHGTHCAGIASAATNNAVGIAGVGWQCRIMPVKVLESSGTGNSSVLASGITFAANNGARVISMSLGGTGNSSTVASAVNAAWSAGVVLVGAAGNLGSTTPNYPAALANVIGVGATDQNDSRAAFSNFGFWVSVAAPGVDILSTYRGGGYRIESGTSMATPQVAGLAGLLWAHLGTKAGAAAIRQRIENNTVPVGSWLSHGRIDARSALANTGPPSEVSTSYAPVTLQVMQGRTMGGSLLSLLASDDSRLDLEAVQFFSGRRAEFEVSAAPIWQGDEIAVDVIVEASTDPSGAVSVSLWNWNASRWESIGGVNLGTMERSTAFRTVFPTLYRSGAGEVRARIVRSELRNRYFRFRTDQVQVATIRYE